MITLWEDNPQWHELLRQEGVSFQTGTRISGRDVVVLNREPGGLHAQRVWEHIESGSGLLAAGINAAAVWLELHPRSGSLRWIAPEGDSPLFRNVGIVDLDTRGALLRGADQGITDSGARAVLATPKGRGFCILLPFEVTRVLSDIGSGPRQFPAGAPRFPYDTVARVGRGEVRRLVANCLRLLLEHKDLPYVHLATVPGRTGSTLGFRVDTDFGPRSDLEAVARLAERVGMKFSWYVNVGAHQAHLDLFRDLARQGHDIQLHCFRHTVYPDYRRNFDNFRRGRDKMAEAGINPVGVVAPFGEWNPDLNRALEDLGFEYSSEFCLAYDDLPFRPAIGGRRSKVLQVPVHPICLGRLVAARASATQMAKYYRSVIDLQFARQEPCFIYDHPERIAQFSDVLADVLAYGKERCGTVTTLTDFARWWQRRERFGWNAEMTHKGLEVKTDEEDSKLDLIVERCDRYAMLPAGPGRHQLAALGWLAKPDPVAFSPASLGARKPSLMLAARDLDRRVRKNLQGHRG